MNASLYEPRVLAGGAEIPNRIAKAAMEENMADRDQAPSEALMQLYQAWAEGGAGLLITGNVMVDGRAMTGPGGVVLEDASQLDKFRRWARVGRSRGAQFWLKINHPGRQMPADLRQPTWAPSAVALDLGTLSRHFNPPQAMTQDLIWRTVQSIGLPLDAVPFGAHVLNFALFERYTVQEALQHFLGYSESDAADTAFLHGIMAANRIVNTMPSESVHWLQYLIFDHLVESFLIQPTFITDLPVEASPLAYSEHAGTTVRFEMFCAGREIANGFQQVLEYEEQVQRFAFQADINGRDGAMEADVDYMNAVRYGMPTVSGCGIGVDRLVMLLTNTENIRDAILYPMVAGTCA